MGSTCASTSVRLLRAACKPLMTMLLAMPAESCPRPHALGESIPPTKIDVCKLPETCNTVVACGADQNADLRSWIKLYDRGLISRGLG